jgi:type IV pilus assembly protein PilV
MKQLLTNRKQRGATLIEALVSILILSLGLLGMAGLQLNALSFEKSSWATHRISEVTSDIAERIRANYEADFNSRYSYSETYGSTLTKTFTANGCRANGASDCTFGKIAENDMAEWQLKTRGLLPGGAALLEGGPDQGYVVTVMYADKDFNTIAGVPQASTPCTSATNGIAWRNCCPDVAAVPNGVRCYRTNVVTLAPE